MEDLTLSMAELERCVYCKMPIKPKDNFVKVIEGPTLARSYGEPIDQQYAHAECYDRKSKTKASGA
jgi:hypothetical protein